MGWCSGTDIFDAACKGIIGDKQRVSKEGIKALTIIVDSLEQHDWDCQQDSRYWDHPVVQQIFRARGWFEDEEEEAGIDT